MSSLISMGQKAKEDFADELCKALLEEGRIVPGRNNKS